MTQPNAQMSVRCRRRARGPAPGSCMPAVPRMRPSRCTQGDGGTLRRIAAERASATTLARPKSRTFTTPRGRDRNVRRLQIAMDDALRVRGVERAGDLPRDRQSFGQGRRPAGPPRVVGEGRAFDEFQDSAGRRRSLRGRRSHRCADGRGRRERAPHAGTAPGARIGREGAWHDLDGDVAPSFVSRAR